MRILITTDTIGGVWRFTQELVAGLLEEQCEIALVSLGAAPSRSQSFWLQDLKSKWPMHFRYTATEFSLEWMQSNEAAYDEAAHLLLRIASEMNADIIHANQFCFGALQTSIPKVVTAHSDVLSWAEFCKAQALEPSPWLSRYRALVSTGLSDADAVAAPTRWMLNALSQNFVLPQEKQVIPNGVSIPSATSVPRKLQAVTAGRLWDEAKNIAMLGEVISPIPILAAGSTICESANAPALSGVHLLGPLHEGELFSLFRESAIYICTSRYEPFGLAPLEAARCGCAILANDIPSLREVWQDAALYFNDAASLALLLHDLSNSPKLLAAAQARSLQQALTYSRQRMTASYLALFKTLVSRPLSKEMADVA